MRIAVLLVLLGVLLGLGACQGGGAGADRLRAISNGQILYQQHCAQCHGKRGEGLARLYPPLAGSDYLAPHANRLACLIRRGQQDTIVVRGDTFSLAMPPNPQLFPEDIAQIVTFICHAWGNDTLFTEPVYLTPAQVKEQLEGCK